VVDHPGALHDPRVALPLDVAALLGAEQGCLLLGASDEHHTLGPSSSLEQGQPFVQDVVLALTLDEVHPRHLIHGREPVDRRNEPVGDLRQRCRRGDLHTKLALQIADQSRRVLQLGHIDVQVHPVDALDLEPHVIGKDISDGAR
jgi:hypothetical protein